MKRMLLLAGTMAAATALSAQPAVAATLVPALMNLRAATAFDGIYTTSTGETVHISVSDQLVPDEAENQSWAEYLATLPHGTELGKVVLYLAPTREVRDLCGRAALACYYGAPERIVLPAEEPTEPPARVSILAHEYGHHIARNRANDPWSALVYGAKRWATQTRVCSGLRSGRLSLDRYELSPSETFAESYRVLVERRLGLEPSPWNIIDPSLEPGEKALSLLEQDVLDPWPGNNTFRVKGTRTRTLRVATPLDGKLTLTLRGPRTAVYELRLPGQPTKRARGQGTVRSSTTVCGTRRTTATVRKVSGRGSFQLIVSRP
jgi:hypothetical protein